MDMFKAVMTVSCVALMGAVVTPIAKADAWDRKTVVTFTEPVEIPGVHLPGWGVLPPGNYVFKILDSQSNRHIIQISNEDETTVYATVLAVPNYRLKATDKTVITFSERPAGQPEALRAWFYPGRNWGEEFVYPKAKAIELARVSREPVLFTPAAIEQEAAEPIRSAREPRAAELMRAPIRAVRPTGEEVELDQAVTPPPAVELAQASPPAPLAQQASPPARMAQSRARTLPDTSSALPLIALFGLFALGGAVVLRLSMRERSS